MTVLASYYFLFKVLSESVANAFEFYGDPDHSETQRFVRYFDTFFDCLNVRSLNEHQMRRKENLRPYSSPNDKRLEVEHLSYLAILFLIKINSGWKRTFWAI